MKVLFAVSNENISEAIIKKYREECKEIILHKNVYYFNAILKEIQRDKSYDRIVISEDLEPFANNDYDAIDKFLFEKLDNISDEASNSDNEDIPIILICSDRRAKSEQLLVKLFGIGVYNAILGADRSIDQVCQLIKKPRSKKEAKIYYKIESDEVNYQSESEDSVSEVEIQNILMHYKKLGKDEEAYVNSFNNIASQYTDSQLKLIIKFLPLNVKAVLEVKSPKYQSLAAFTGTSGQDSAKSIQKQENKEKLKINFIENQLNKDKAIKQVVVPSAVNTSQVKKVSRKQEIEPLSQNNVQEEEEDTFLPMEDITESVDQKQTVNVDMQDFEQTSINENIVEQPKRKRGRPRKIDTTPKEDIPEQPKRKRGRPRKVLEEPITTEDVLKNDNLNQEEDSIGVLPGFESSLDSEFKDEMMLPGLGDNDERNQYMPSEEAQSIESNDWSNIQTLESDSLLNQNANSIVERSTNGTSFIINNLAQVFSDMGIKIAILDTTQNKNSYYIYTKNEEELRSTAYSCMEKLTNGVAEGIKVTKNLTVYTSLPTVKKEENYEAILSNLLKNYSLVLLDCDFDTPLEYFRAAQEIYLVQSMDILTIQPLTGFLRELKAKGILKQEKFKVIINKVLRVKSLNAKLITGGISYYNDPSMSVIIQLFDKDKLKALAIPFDQDVYSKYLDGLVECKISLSGYPKPFMAELKKLADTVYPLLDKKYVPRQVFSQDTNN